ncbi:MAG: hypothetical protein Kow0063_16930 [Anaerolineae bacterium]
MTSDTVETTNTGQLDYKAASVDLQTQDIAVDLTWVDMMKGIAIIGVFFDNWTHYMVYGTTPAFLYSLGKAFSLAVGPFVQVFFILSGFGLTLTYLRKSKVNWDWRRWTWRRVTKIIIPYFIFVLVSFLLGVIGSHLYTSVDVKFSWTSLLAHLTLTRNFYPLSWEWNPPLWFMPVIVGLYVSFPVLVTILQRWGIWVLLLFSVLISYGTLTIAVLVGAPQSHGADLFTFWVLQFALGMILAHLRETSPQRLRYLTGPGAFLLGVGLMVSSWALRTYVPPGKSFNDSLTSVGIFLILLNVVWASRTIAPATGAVLKALSGRSYFMYLIHYPIMQFLIGPLLRVPANPIVVIALGALYILFIYFVCYLVAPPIESFTSWAYQNIRWNKT